MIKINISKEFSDTPGGRFKKEGPNSGEEFREKLLEPRYIEAKNNKEKLEINLDDCYGHPTSFLEESFGGLARNYPDDNILETIIFISNDQPSLIEKIRKYIKEANN